MASSGKRPVKLPKGPSPQKAEKMLKDNQAQGQPLSKKQNGFFRAIIGRGWEK